MKITEFTTSFLEPIEIIAARLIENLHLRWQYCVFHVDEYTDEQDRAVYTIFGLQWDRQNQPKPKLFMVWLSELSKAQTQLRLMFGDADVKGYPIQHQAWADSRQYAEDEAGNQFITRDILNFCRVPHGEGSGVVDWLRRAVDRLLPGTTPKSKRRYPPGRKSS